MSGPDRRLDRKLGAITAGRYTPGDFVIADAKDADMAFGLTSAGPARDSGSNAPAALAPGQVGAFVNDSITRALAGVTEAQRPLFLKVAYNGPDALAELAGYDPSLVVGILGGSAGTTRDTFELLHQAERHGARVALFGRKIQHAESQLDLVSLMRPVLRSELSPADAVRAYHDALAKAEIAPHRDLEADLEVTDPVLRAG
jgi:hypothetical protein